LEVIFFQGTTLASVAILAPPPAAVLAAQLMSVFESFFSHANASLPPWVQRTLGVFIYTADAHRIHHCADIRMQNTNFGDIFPWWDRLSRTYLPPLPADGNGMVMGLDEPQPGAHPGVGFLLKQPFLRKR